MTISRSERDRNSRPRRRNFGDDEYQTPNRNFGYTPPYNPAKGFGFVALADASGDAFLHAKVIQAYGSHEVLPGTTLEIRSQPGAKGLQVAQILRIDTSTATQEQRKRPRPDRLMHPYADRPTAEELGTVTWYNLIKDFGFIAPDRGGKDIFIHITALEESGMTNLAEGQRVVIDVAEGRSGPEVVRVPLVHE